MPLSNLSPAEMIPDLVLATWEANYARQRPTKISDIDTAMLVMVLTDLCGELLARRAAMRLEGLSLPETLTDETLRELAKDTPMRQMGEFSGQEHCTLVCNLSGLSRELMHRRAFMQVQDAA